jgi:hypothetical protein
VPKPAKNTRKGKNGLFQRGSKVLPAAGQSPKRPPRQLGIRKISRKKIFPSNLQHPKELKPSGGGQREKRKVEIDRGVRGPTIPQGAARRQQRRVARRGNLVRKNLASGVAAAERNRPDDLGRKMPPPLPRKCSLMSHQMLQSHARRKQTRTTSTR